MRIPPRIRQAVEQGLEGATGRPTRLARVDRVGGGCINASARVETVEGDLFFVKWNEDAPAGMFEAEADGLRALGRPGVLRVPEVVATHPAWLVLEYVESGTAGPDYGERLGRSLAELHRTRSEKAAARATPWGWPRDNFIGSLPQANDGHARWAGFWRERRIGPQLEAARESGYLTGRGSEELDRVMREMEEALDLAEEDGPSLLHGDLWSGNVFADGAGRPTLVDPAVYRGHREVDLAMTELFGGFGSAFYDAYDEAWPLREGYRPVRRALYQLYYLLVHVNLFGGGYVGRTVAAAREALGGL